MDAAAQQGVCYRLITALPEWPSPFRYEQQTSQREILSRILKRDFRMSGVSEHDPLERSLLRRQELAHEYGYEHYRHYGRGQSSHFPAPAIHSVFSIS